jgi:hypothetical protein
LEEPQKPLAARQALDNYAGVKIANRARRSVIRDLHKHRRGNRELVCLCIFSLAASLHAAPQAISFSQSSDGPEVYDYVEVMAQLQAPDAVNPFLEGTLTGSLDWALLLRRKS